MKMTPEQLKTRTLEGFTRMFNSGELDFVDGALAPGAIDHQEPEVRTSPHTSST